MVGRALQRLSRDQGFSSGIVKFVLCSNNNAGKTASWIYANSLWIKMYIKQPTCDSFSLLRSVTEMECI